MPRSKANQDKVQAVNIRVSKEIHEWFKMRSENTGIPMSSLMFLALEQHIQQQTMIPHVKDILEQSKKINYGGGQW